MLGKGQLKTGVKTLYKDGNLNVAWSKKASSTPMVDVLKQTASAYQVKVHSELFNPDIVWVRKGDVVNIVWKVVPKPPSSDRNVNLQTGDTMGLFDKDGKRMGTWTFKKD